ncbi:hypothetical protein BDY24DRAFT_437411 [Mrakia frigida]|uniref:uncharacterized protein n=1 Tax=Mrakia frigida TaxID=29902 RepID=UPI003FCC126F
MEDPVALPPPPPSEKDLPTPTTVDSPLTEAPPLPPPPPPPVDAAPSDPPPIALPKLRPLPPKKGILKPPRPAQKSVFSSFRPSQLVGKLLGDGEPPRPPPTARERERDRLAALAAQAQGTTQAGAFFSRALGRLSMAAGGVAADPSSSFKGSNSSSSSAPPPSASSSWSPRSAVSAASASITSSLPSSSSASNSNGSSTPTGPPATQVETPLKRASFLLSSVSITYPISSSLPPCSPSVSQSIQEIESNHVKKYKEEGGWEWWNGERLVELYERASKAREEKVDSRIRELLKKAATPKPPAPRVLNLSNIVLTKYSAEAIADVLAVEWGLTKLVLDGCDLTDESLKPILHALLVSGTLPTLSLANNKKLKLTGFKILAVFLRKATHLRYLDISDNLLDKKSVDSLVASLSSHSNTLTSTGSPTSTPAPLLNRSGTMDSTFSTISSVAEEGGPSVGEQLVEDGSKPRVSVMPKAPLLGDDGRRIVSVLGSDAAEGDVGLATLRLDGCGLRGASLESLAQGVRNSTIVNISLRRNKISSLGGVALAIMIKDIPDQPHQTSSNPFSSQPPPSSSSTTSSTNTTSNSSSALTPAGNSEPGPATTYSAYTPRRRQTASSAQSQSEPSSSTDANGEAALKPIPQITTNLAGGVTKRTLPAGYSLDTPDGSDDEDQNDVLRPPAAKGVVGSSLAGATMMQSRVRSLDDVMRMGKLVTLDLKGNDLRAGVGYIAQVLKRNRTLRVCNLAENKIDVAGLVALAEALKYNSTLDTLDLSHNPCCGPGLEGITTLRTAFTINSNLKRLFLADTSLSTEGAIALAEFLPEARHLLHLDLTENGGIEVAGIMALAVGLRSNRLLRCLDLSIPLNDEDVASLSQDILQSCIRNTELAQQKSTSKAARLAVWGPIQKSLIARSVKESDEARALAEANASASTPAGKARTAVFELSPSEVITSAEEVIQSLDESMEIQASLGVVMDEMRTLIEKGKVLRERLEEIVQGTTDGDRLQVLLGLVDRLSSQLEKGIKVASAEESGNAPIRRLTTGASSNNNTPTNARQLSSSSNTPTNAHSTPTPASRIASSSPHHAPTPLSFIQTNSSLRQPSTPTTNSSSRRPDASESITSPSFSIADSDTEEEDSDAEELTANPRQHTFNIPLPPSPAVAMFDVSANSNGSGGEEKSRAGEFLTVEGEGEEGGEVESSPTKEKRTNWTEEEGEVFRKGAALLALEDDEEVEEVSGEELRKEILETPLERPAPRRLSVDLNEDETSVAP